MKVNGNFLTVGCYANKGGNLARVVFFQICVEIILNQFWVISGEGSFAKNWGVYL